jgi:meso-butanediol dehydrogenase/(S,S)-butanediol dehydrogenase/diacetyl reductase
MRLEGKIAMVTGGVTGLGKTVALRLAAEGAKVACVGVDVIDAQHSQYESRNIGGYAAAKEVVAELQTKGSDAIAIETDVTKWVQVEGMVKQTVAAFGRVDIVVNCAGIITFYYVSDLSEADWDSVMAVNAKGTFLVNKAAAAQMQKQGGGKIINISSIAGKRGNPGTAHYAASKFAVLGFTQALAKEVARDNITVNAICPGIIGTQMWKLLSIARALPGETEQQSYERIVRDRIPQGVEQTGEDIAEAVVFLAVSDHVTGQSIVVDGGATA